MRTLVMLLCAGVALICGCDDSDYPFQVIEDSIVISYSLADVGVVDVTVSNDCMFVVRTLVDSQEQPSGPNSVLWDLTDDGGAYVGDGLYTAEITVDGEVISVQVMEVKEQ